MTDEKDRVLWETMRDYLYNLKEERWEESPREGFDKVRYFVV